jgi:hypothetical protein
MARPERPPDTVVVPFADAATELEQVREERMKARGTVPTDSRAPSTSCHREPAVSVATRESRLAVTVMRLVMGSPAEQVA